MQGSVGYSTHPQSTQHWNVRCGVCKRLFMGVVKRTKDAPPDEGRAEAEAWLETHEATHGA